jgi:glycosyltransferase involved in cell wall biosynthesis
MSARPLRIALVVPGGVDRSGERRVIPALLALIARLSVRNELHVFALRQQELPQSWELAGAYIHNVGGRFTRLRAVRAILSQHRKGRFDLVQSVWSGASGLVAASAARLLRVPCIVHVAGGELVAIPDIHYGGRLSWRGRLREAVVLRSATRVTAASAPMIRSLGQLGIRTQRLPLGVDLSVWSPREPQPRDLRKPAKLIHAASLNRVKDQPMLLRALQSLAACGVDFEIELVGEDTLSGEIQGLAERLGLAERVRFRGFLPQSELVPLVAAAHLMIVSSRHEAGPLAVLEAAAVGVPTIGTAVGHIAEWAPDAAIAVPVGDWAELARAINAVLGDEAWRLRIAREAGHRAVAENADFTAQSLQSLYSQLAA